METPEAGRRRKPSPRQVEALTAVSAGRVKWGNPYPRMARKGHAGPLMFLLNGHSVYAGEHATYSRLAELGWIVERVDLLPQKTVPAQTRTYGTLTGTVTRELPAYQAPADDGWQAIVELTDAGRAALESAQPGSKGSTLRDYDVDEVETAQALVDNADREFGDYSRTDLLLDNMESLRNVEDAHGLLAVIGVGLRPDRPR